MSVSGIGSGSPSSFFQQRRQDLKQIIGAVQAGDIAGAQRMLTAYQQNAARAQAAGPASAPSRTGARPASPLKHDLAALVDSIRSGDMASARTALTVLEPGRAAAPATPAAGASRAALDSDLDALLRSVGSSGAPGGVNCRIAAPEPAWTTPAATRAATPDDLFARVLAAYQNSASA